MKTTQILFTAMLLPCAVIAQIQQNSTPEQLGARRALRIPHHSYNMHPDRSIINFTTDYAYLDDQFYGNIFANNDAYGWDLGTGGLKLRDATVTLDTLVDILSLSGYDWADIGQYTIDSVYIALGHWNSSGQSNKFTFSLIDLGLNNYPNYNDAVLWTDSIVTSSNLWGQTSWLQFFYLPFAPNVTVPSSKRIGVRIEFEGAVGDTGAIMAWWLNNGPCGTNTYDASVRSFFYPHSFEYWDQFSMQVPTFSGNDVYYDCNSNSQYDQGVDGENFIQDIDAYFVITATYCSGYSASFTSTDASCGQNDGSASCNPTGGVTPYSYQWDSNAGNQTTQTATGLAAGTYNVTVTDNEGCTEIFQTTVNNNVIISSSATTVSPACVGGCEGSIDLTVSGGATPYTYNWSNGNTDEDPDSLCAGSYMVTITDNNNCITTDTFTVTDPPALVITGFNTTPSSTNCDGSATVNASGGSPAYSYLWDDTNNQTTQTATGLCVGIYHVTVTDSANCTIADSVSVNATGLADATPFASTAIHPNPSDGQFVLEITVNRAQRISVELLNVVGQVVFSEDLGKLSGHYTKHFKLKSLDNGVYSLRLISAAGNINKKIILK